MPVEAPELPQVDPKRLPTHPAQPLLAATDFFRRPLMDVPSDKTSNIRQALRDSLERDFQKDKPRMRQLFPDLSDRECLLIYLLGRVGGSLPIYRTTGVVNSLEDWLWTPYGNCAHHAARLAMVLDAFDIPSAFMGICTPAYPGHAVVDAWDPEEKVAYLFDANYFTYISSKPLKRLAKEGGGIVWTFLNMTPEDREKMSEKLIVHVLPRYFEFVDPGNQAFAPSPVTPNLMNSQRAELAGRWKQFLGHELDLNRDYWKKVVVHAPHSLRELMELGWSEMAHFNPRHALTADYGRFWEKDPAMN